MSGVDKLEAALGRVAEAVKRVAPLGPTPQYPELEFPEAERKAIETILKSMKELEGIDKKLLQRANSGSSLSISKVARSVLERLSVGVEPNIIVSDLLDLLRSEEHYSYYLVGIGGVDLKHSVQLASDVKLSVVEDVQPSAAREAVFRIDRFQRRKGNSTHETIRPKVALVIGSNQKVIFSRDEPGRRFTASEDPRIIQHRVLMCITLSGKDVAPVYSAQTSWIDHPAIPIMVSEVLVFDLRLDKNTHKNMMK